MCKEKSNQEVISMAQLFDKIRESTDIYENSQYWSNILYVVGETRTPLTFQRLESTIEQVIEVVPRRLESLLWLTSPATIRFEYIRKSEICHQRRFDILWEVSVNVEDIVKSNEEIIKNNGITTKH